MGAAVHVVAEEEEGGGRERGAHAPQRLLEAHEVVEVAVQVAEDVAGRGHAEQARLGGEQLEQRAADEEEAAGHRHHVHLAPAVRLLGHRGLLALGAGGRGLLDLTLEVP